jgi:hypothetical protein
MSVSSKKSEFLIFDRQLTELERVYELIDPKEVLRVLAWKPRVVELLLEGRTNLEKYLPGARVTIERDKKSRFSQHATLFVTVYPPETMSEVREAIEQFNENWFVSASPEIGGQFYISYEHPSLGKAWDWLKNIVGKVEAPEDWSAQTDHYLHGAPKHNS